MHEGVQKSHHGVLTARSVDSYYPVHEKEHIDMMVCMEYSYLLEAFAQHEEHGVQQIEHLVQKEDICYPAFTSLQRMIEREGMHAFIIVRRINDDIVYPL